MGETSNPQPSQKKEGRPQMNMGSYSQFNESEDIGLDNDSDDFGLDYVCDGFGFDGYDFSDPFLYDDYMDPLHYDEEDNYRDDYWNRYRGHGPAMPGFEVEVEVDEDKIFEMAVLQKEENELIENPTNIGEMSKFPLEIVFDILSRLPIKTLARCRCVSKGMRRITHIRRFIEMHHKRAITQGDIPPSILLHVKSFTDPPLCMLQHDTPDDTLEGRVVFAKPLSSFEKKGFDIVGSCNGLLCLAVRMCNVNGPRYVCNPVTGEFISIPKRINFNSNIVYGFGYDEVVNDYKVVRMVFHLMDADPLLWDLEGEVYSLSLGKWRKIQTDGQRRPYNLRPFASPAFVNGALHWMDDHGGLIVSFHLGSEEFQIVPLPPDLISTDCLYFSRDVGVLGECLCLFNYSDDNGKLEIWAMKEYGIQSSWSKEYVIEDSGYDSDSFKPLRLMRNGELLMSYEGKWLVSYDPVKKQLRDIQIKGLPPHSDATIHAASLLPLRNAVGLANKDKFNFSFSKWCSESFPIPGHESITYGDEQPAEHGNTDEDNEEDSPLFKKPKN